MKTNRIATRVVAGVLPAMALFATSGYAQEAVQPAPPTAPPIAQPAAPVAVQAPATPAGPSADDRAKFEASVNAATGSANTAATSEAAPTQAAPAVTTRSTAARAAPAPRAAVPARPATVSPSASPTATAPAPVSPAASATAAPVAPATETAPTEPATATETTTRETTTVGGAPMWGWVIGALAVLGLAVAGWLALRRRNEQDEIWESEEIVPADHVAVAAPVAEPVAEHVALAEPAAEDVAAITETAAPVAGRPWIELSLRPVRAGSTDEAATVDLELTLANAGEVSARDVRVTTFMLGDASATPTEMERLLALPHADHAIDAGEIGAGEGSRVDATLAIPRDEMAGATFQPVVVADVRYSLPGGGEGRTAAAFTVGGDDGTDLPTPLRLGGDTREDVAAALHGVPERA